MGTLFINLKKLFVILPWINSVTMKNIHIFHLNPIAEHVVAILRKRYNFDFSVSFTITSETHGLHSSPKKLFYKLTSLSNTMIKLEKKFKESLVPSKKKNCPYLYHLEFQSPEHLLCEIWSK